MFAHKSHLENSVFNAHARLSARSSAATATLCSECGGTGVVRVWSEFAFFEDMRACSRYDAGNRVEAVIADIMKRATRQYFSIRNSCERSEEPLRGSLEHRVLSREAKAHEHVVLGLVHERAAGHSRHTRFSNHELV